MKRSLISLTAPLLLVATSILITGCDSNPAKATTETVAEREERCMATGSHLPRRDCRDVKMIDPESLRNAVPTLGNAGGAAGGK
jgi:hypothetical protein